MKKILALVMMAAMTMMAGCGGDSGGGGNPTAATLKVSSQGTMPAGKAVSGIDVSLELPTGATVKTTTTGAVDPTVVVASGLMAGAATLTEVVYTPATTTAKAKLDFQLASTAVAGVAVGEYATVTLVLSGINPAVTDFTVKAFKAYDMSFAPIDALTSKLALTTN